MSLYNIWKHKNLDTSHALPFPKHQPRVLAAFFEVMHDLISTDTRINLEAKILAFYF